jgi:hypothetical protein
LEHFIRPYEERWNLSKSSKEREQQARRTANQMTKPLKLAMGEPNRCLYNATRAVWAHPDRLVYVEGFYVNEYHLTQHAWVLDKLTGTRHELSFQHHDVYVGKEFTQDEMIDRNEELFDGGPRELDGSADLQGQFEILTQAGYDVELARYRCVEETEWLVEYGDIVDPSSTDMTLGGGDDDEGWGYGWRKRNCG